MKVLIADPTDAVRAFLSRCLHLDGHEVFAAASMTQAWALCQTQKPPIVVTELRFRDGDGLELVGKLKRMVPSPYVVTLVLDNRTETEVDAYAAGSNNHLIKPLVYDRILAIINSVANTVRLESTVRCGTLVVDDLSHRIWVDDQELFFSDKEFAIVSLLCRHQDTVVTNESLIAKVWGRMSDPDDLHRHIIRIIGMIRKKSGKEFIFLVPDLGGYTMSNVAPLWAGRRSQPQRQKAASSGKKIGRPKGGKKKGWQEID